MMSWIRIDDYLPEPYRNVLIYIASSIGPSYIIGYREDDGCWVTLPQHSPGKITHWTYLPDPPVGSEWISIKDRLPDYGEDVLVCDFAGNIFKGYRRKECSEWALRDATHHVAANKEHVYYWQPLPGFIKRFEKGQT